MRYKSDDDEDDHKEASFSDVITHFCISLTFPTFCHIIFIYMFVLSFYSVILTPELYFRLAS